MKKAGNNTGIQICRQLAEAYVSAYALLAVFHVPFPRNAFESGIDYITASIYELLGEYDFRFLFLLALCFLFFRCLPEKVRMPEKPVPFWLPVLFSLFLLGGRSYQETATWRYLFGSPVNFIKSMIVLTGYTLLLKYSLDALTSLLERSCFTDDTTENTHFWSRHSFGKAFCLLYAVYFPFLLLSFPGKLCWDSIGQIEQVIFQTGYTAHHPLAHTLLTGGLTKLGKQLFGSYEAGLFCYMLLQLAFLSAALASTIAALSRRHMKQGFLWLLFVLYCITPVYSNMASTAVKDVPFASAMVGYIVCLALLLEMPERLKNIKFAAVFLAVQICVILFRNNGIYVVLPGSIVILLCFLKKYRRTALPWYFLGSSGGSILLGRTIMFVLALLCNAAPGSRGEMLSIPFQQTARYLSEYGDQITAAEKEAIEAVLGDTAQVAEKYDFKSADPVKALFRKDASREDIFAYLKQWAYGLTRHPAVYAEAFLTHVCGWFSPEVSNSIRYENDYDLIRQEGLFPYAEKLLIFCYRFAARFPVLGFLENIGGAVWALFFLTLYQRRHKKGGLIWAEIPLWITLLVCMASPGFMGHPRYAFPILFSIPFLYGYTLTGKSAEYCRAALQYSLTGK